LSKRLVSVVPKTQLKTPIRGQHFDSSRKAEKSKRVRKGQIGNGERKSRSLAGRSRHDRVISFQYKLVVTANQDSLEVRKQICDQTMSLVRELFDEQDRIAEYERCVPTDMLEGAIARARSKAFGGKSPEDSQLFLSWLIEQYLEAHESFSVYVGAGKGREWLAWSGHRWEWVNELAIKRMMQVDLQRWLLQDAAVL